MGLSEEQKKILVERLAKARAAKVAKAKQIKETKETKAKTKKEKEPPKPKPMKEYIKEEPKEEPKENINVVKEDVNIVKEDVNIDKEDVNVKVNNFVKQFEKDIEEDDANIMPIKNNKKEGKEGKKNKEQYLKIKFYKEPSKKLLSKVMNSINESSESESESDDVVQPPPLRTISEEPNKNYILSQENQRMAYIRAMCKSYYG